MEFELSRLPPLPDSPVAPMTVYPTARSPTRPDRPSASPYKSVRSPSKHMPVEAASPKMELVYTYPTSPVKGRAPSSGFIISPRKPVSPKKVPLPPSPVRPALPSSQLNASFMMPANLSESMIGDTSMPTLLMDDSIDFALPACLQSNKQGPERTPGDTAPRSTTPVQQRPTTPPRTASARPTPAAQAGSKPRESPLKTPTASIRDIIPTALTAPRTVVSRAMDAGDISTLFPVSPARTAHLLGDEHQLLRESLPGSGSDAGDCDGDGSFFLPPPPLSTRKTPRKPNKADMTLDINELIAGMSKPKRPSGTEESFEDLLNAPGFDLDQSILGGEPFLPPGLRSRAHRPQSISPVKHTPARLRNAAAGVVPSPANMDPPRTATRAPPTVPTPRAAIDSPVRRQAAAPRTPATLATIGRTAVSPSRPTPATSAAPAVPGPRTAINSPVRREPAPPRTPAGPATISRTAASPSRPTPAASTTRRLPISSGPLAPSTSASVPRSVLPSTSTARPVSTARSSMAAPATRPTSLVRTGSIKTGESRLASGLTRTATSPPKTAMPLAAAGRPGHSRTGSSATLSGLAPGSRTAAATARPAVGSASTRPASFRPTSNAAKSSLPPTSSRTALPQPGVGPSARSALTRPIGSTTTTSRAFGTDGSTTSNRLSGRPATATTTAASRLAAPSGKLSMAPPASPAKRETAASLKSRAASTPANTVARSIPRPAVSSTKSSIPPPTTTRTAPSSKSALPRPQTSRLPAPGTTTGKMSSGSSRTTNLLALRDRINALSANQSAAASRRA